MPTSTCLQVNNIPRTGGLSARCDEPLQKTQITQVILPENFVYSPESNEQFAKRIKRAIRKEKGPEVSPPGPYVTYVQ